MAPPLAAVTGATGFLGGHLVDALLAEGCWVRALVRRPGAEARWAGAPVETAPGDLGDDGSLDQLCAGASAVVHVAGVIAARRACDFHRVNVAGAARVAAAARRGAPDAAFVLVSSLAAREPGISPYASSKRDGEVAVREVLGRAAWIARPCALYGPGDRATLPLFRAAATSPVLPVLDPHARIALMHGADAARAILALARLPPALEPLELSDVRRKGYSWSEIMRTAAEAVGRQPRLIRVPAAAVRVAGRLGDALSFLGGAPALTSGKARELLHADWSVRSALSPAEARFDLAAGFREAVAWYRAHGLLGATV